MRTFIAIELDADVRRPLLKLLRDELPRAEGVRWVTDQQLHLTLKFLGEVGDDQLAKVCDAAATASAQVEPFVLNVAGLGCFPGPRNPRVLWCGVDDPTSGCRRWVEAVDPLLADMGFKPETRAFTPHITLGRGRSTAAGHVIQRVLETLPPPRTAEMSVDRMTVFESRLSPRGAQYEVLATIPLGGRIL